MDTRATWRCWDTCLMSCSGSQVWCGDGYTWHVALLGHVLSADTRWQGKSELLCGLLLAAGNTAIITTFRPEMGGDRLVSYSYSDHILPIIWDGTNTGDS